MNKVFKKVIASLFVVILTSCGSNQTDVTDKQLSSGISPSTKSAEFGQPASSDAVAALSKELGSYFNGQYASNPQALMGAQATAGKQLVVAQAVATSNVAKEVFRFYNTNTGSHFFTMSVAERDYIQNTFPFFSYEGSKFFAYTDADPALSPVYRFYNKVTGTHFYTVNAAEKDHVIATWPTIFNYEGVAWYASAVSTLSGAYLVPIYRFFNAHTGTHFYTASAAEKNHIIATWNWFSFEGIAYYALQNAPVITPTSGFGLVSNLSGGSYDKTECVKDYKTGLVWEGKPASGWRTEYFTNYTSAIELQKLIGNAFNGNVIYPTQSEIDVSTNSIGFKNNVNSINLCGFNDWRLPTTTELMSLVLIDPNNSWAQIDLNWFPNTSALSYWTSTTSPRGYIASEVSELVKFDYGTQGYQYRDSWFKVRLVRP